MLNLMASLVRHHVLPAGLMGQPAKTTALTVAWLAVHAGRRRLRIRLRVEARCRHWRQALRDAGAIGGSGAGWLVVLPFFALAGLRVLSHALRIGVCWANAQPVVAAGGVDVDAVGQLETRVHEHLVRTRNDAGIRRA